MCAQIKGNNGVHCTVLKHDGAGTVTAGPSLKINWWSATTVRVAVFPGRSDYRAITCSGHYLNGMKCNSLQVDTSTNTINVINSPSYPSDSSTSVHPTGYAHTSSYHDVVGVSPTLAVQCSNDGNSGWKVRCSVLELDETTNSLTSHYDDTSSVLLTEDFSMPHRIIMTAMDLNHAVVCYVSQNYYNGVCRLITLGSNGAAKLTAGPVFEYAGGYYQGRVNNDKVFGHSIAKLSRTTALVCFKDSVTVCRRLKILDEVAGTMDFTDVGSMNMCAGHYHIGIAVHDALSATLCFTAQFTGTSGIVECASVVETEATDHTCANEWSAYPEALPVCPVAASGTTGGSSSSPAPSSGSGGSSGDYSPSPGALSGGGGGSGDDDDGAPADLDFPDDDDDDGDGDGGGDILIEDDVDVKDITVATLNTNATMVCSTTTPVADSTSTVHSLPRSSCRVLRQGKNDSATKNIENITGDIKISPFGDDDVLLCGGTGVKNNAAACEILHWDGDEIIEGDTVALDGPADSGGGDGDGDGSSCDGASIGVTTIDIHHGLVCIDNECHLLDMDENPPIDVDSWLLGDDCTSPDLVNFGDGHALACYVDGSGSNNSSGKCTVVGTDGEGKLDIGQEVIVNDGDTGDITVDSFKDGKDAVVCYEDLVDSTNKCKILGETGDGSSDLIAGDSVTISDIDDNDENAQATNKTISLSTFDDENAIVCYEGMDEYGEQVGKCKTLRKPIDTDENTDEDGPGPLETGDDFIINDGETKKIDSTTNSDGKVTTCFESLPATSAPKGYGPPPMGPGDPTSSALCLVLDAILRTVATNAVVDNTPSAASVPASPATPSSASMTTAPSSSVEASTTAPSPVPSSSPSANNGGSAAPSSASMTTAPSSSVEASTTAPSPVPSSSPSTNNGGSASLPNAGGDSLSTSPSSFNENGGGSNGGSNSADTNNDTGNASSWFWPAMIGGCVVLLCVCVGCIAKSSKGVRSRLGIEESKQSLAKHKTWESFDLSNIELVENPLDKMEPESSDQGTVPV